MARGRMISNSISESRKFAALASHEHRLIYLMVLPWVDKAGRFEADPVVIKSKCLLRLDVDLSTVQAWLKDAANVGLITVYEADGIPVLEITNFLEHNTPHHKEPESVFPGPEEVTPVASAETPSDTAPVKHASSMSQSSTEHAPTLPIIEIEVEDKEEVEETLKSVSQITPDPSPPPAAEPRKLTLDDLIRIWNQERGQLVQCRSNKDPQLQRLGKAFLQRHRKQPDGGEELFRAGIATVREDPIWLRNRAPRPTGDRAHLPPLGLVNYLRHVESKADAALDSNENRVPDALEQYKELGL